MATMKKNKRVVTVRHPRRALPAVFGFTKDELMKMSMSPRISLALFQEGNAGPKDWECVLSRLATGREVSINLFTDDTGETIHRAFVLWADAFIRWQQTKIWQFTHEQYRQVSESLDLTDAAMEGITRKEYLRIFNNALDVTIEDLSELVSSWDDYKKRREFELTRHGRKSSIT